MWTQIHGLRVPWHCFGNDHLVCRRLFYESKWLTTAHLWDTFMTILLVLWRPGLCQGVGESPKSPSLGCPLPVLCHQVPKDIIRIMAFFTWIFGSEKLRNPSKSRCVCLYHKNNKQINLFQQPINRSHKIKIHSKRKGKNPKPRSTVSFYLTFDKFIFSSSALGCLKILLIFPCKKICFHVKSTISGIPLFILSLGFQRDSFFLWE